MNYMISMTNETIKAIRKCFINLSKTNYCTTINNMKI